MGRKNAVSKDQENKPGLDRLSMAVNKDGFPDGNKLVLVVA